MLLALLVSSETRQRFPPQLGWSSGEEGRGAFGTLFFHILPWMEENQLYESMLVPAFGQLQRAVHSSSGSGTYTEYPNTFDSRHHHGRAVAFIGNRTIATYRCPSDDSAGYVVGGFGWAGGSYASNFQVFGQAPSVVVGTAVNTSNRPHLLLWEGRARARTVADGAVQSARRSDAASRWRDARRPAGRQCPQHLLSDRPCGLVGGDHASRRRARFRRVTMGSAGHRISGIRTTRPGKRGEPCGLKFVQGG